MAIYFHGYSRLLRHFVFPTNWEKLDQKALNALDDAKNDEEVMEQLEKLITASAECFDCYASAREVHNHVKRFNHSLNLHLTDQKCRVFIEKVHLFDMLCRCPSNLESDDGLLKFTVTAYRRRLEHQLKGSYELVPKSTIFAASDSFSRGLRAEVKLKLTVSTWTPEKVYEQFAALYDKNQDQETLLELKEHMMMVGKSRPPKKNASWYAKAYKTHVMIMEAIRSAVEAHPVTFKPYAKTKKITKTQPAVIRVFIDDFCTRFVFQKDMETVVTTAMRNKGLKKPEFLRSEDYEMQIERGFVPIVSYWDFEELLKDMGIDKWNDISMIEQRAARRLGHIGTVLMSPNGTPCKSAVHVFNEILMFMIYEFQVWSRLEKKNFEKFQSVFEKVLNECFIPHCGNTDYIEDSAAMGLTTRVIKEIMPLLIDQMDPRPTMKIVPGVGFTLADLRKEIVENLGLAVFYPNITHIISDVYWKIRGDQSIDGLTQSDLMVAVVKCLAHVIYETFDTFHVHEDLETGASSINPISDSEDSVQLQLQKTNEANPPRVQNWSEFVTEKMDFIKVDQNDRILRHRTSSERIFTNRTAMVFTLVSVWDRIFISAAQEIPKLRPLEEVVENSEELRLFYVTENEMLEIVDELEIKFRNALEDKAVAVGPCDDVCDSLFRIFEKKVCETLLNLEAMMTEYCERTIIIRTMAMVRTEASEKNRCFAGEILEALDILMIEREDAIEDRHLALYEDAREEWRRESCWNTASLSDILTLLNALPIDLRRIRFVPDVRFLHYLIIRPFINSYGKCMLCTLHSPKYTQCTSMKRINCGTVLSALTEIDDVPDARTGARSVATNELSAASKSNCQTGGLITVGNLSKSMVTLESLSENDMISCTKVPTTKQLLEISVEAEKICRKQLNFLKFAFHSDQEMRKTMAEEITFEIFEKFPNYEAFEQWVISDFEMPRSGDKEAVREWMKVKLENDKIRKWPEDLEKNDEVEEIQPSDAPDVVESPESGGKNKKKKKKAADKAISDKIEKRSEKFTELLEQLKDLASKPGVADDAMQLEYSIIKVFEEFAEKSIAKAHVTENHDKLNKQVEDCKERMAITNAELLTLQEQFELLKKAVKDKKWEKELAAIQKTLTEKEKRIGVLEDRIEEGKEVLSREVEKRKEEVAKKDVEIQKMKDRLERQEQQYKRKMDSVERLTAENARLVAQQREWSDSEATETSRILQLNHDNQILAAKNRELNRRILELSGSSPCSSVQNNAAIRQIRDGLNKLIQSDPIEVRAPEIAGKLEEFEIMKDRLSRESMMGKAIVVIRDFTNACTDQAAKEAARLKFEAYRIDYHKFSNILRNNIKMIKEDCTATMAELTPLPPFPMPFSVQQAVAGDVADSDCLICLNDMLPGEQTTRCDICRRHFHAECVSKWLLRNSICPVCRSPLPDPAEFPPLR